jgi:hypothetical protein
MAVPHYLRRATGGIFLTGLAFLVLPGLLRLYDPSAGSFNIDTLNALALGAVLFSGVLHLGLVAFERFLPRFYEYQRESLEGEGKLFENLTDDLEAGLTSLQNQVSYGFMEGIQLQVERRKSAQFKFTVRCVRLLFCLLSLAYLLHLALELVKTSMLAVPAPVPAL